MILKGLAGFQAVDGDGGYRVSAAALRADAIEAGVTGALAHHRAYGAEMAASGPKQRNTAPTL